MPKLSVIVPYFESVLSKRDMLKRCVDSMQGQYDELIIVNDIEPRGMTRAVVQGFHIAHGDFILVVSDDAELKHGKLSSLLHEDAVTSPLLNGENHAYWGPVFCTPRGIYERAGTWDIVFDGGLGYDDEEYWDRLKFMGIETRAIPSVDFAHPWGGTTIKDTGAINERVARNRDIFKKITEERWKNQE